MKTVIIIPTYNEKENVTALIPAVFSLGVENLEMIFVDDNSPDGTAGAIKSFQNQCPVHIIERPEKMGLGSAYIAGFKRALEAGADYIFEMDADFSHDPKDIPRLIAACADGADLAIGSRKIPGGGIVGWNWRRHFESNGAMLFARLMLGLTTRDVTAGFRCFRRRAIEAIDWNKIKSNGYAFQEEVLYRMEKAGLRVVEVPVIFRDRRIGQSKLSKKDIFEFFHLIFKLKLQKNPR